MNITTLFQQMIYRSDLSPREKEILIYRMRGLTLEEVGRMYAVTRERIKQIEDGAVKHLQKQHNQNL